MNKHIALIMTVMLSSCSFLDENPVTQVSEREIYTTEEGLETAIYGCYRGLLGSSSPAGSMQEFLQVSSGLDHWSYAANRLTDEARLCSLDFTQYSQNTYGYTAWTSFYSCIMRCNKLIESVGDSNPVSQQFRSWEEGEARLLRALSYFYLVRCYGDIPIYLKSPKSVSEGNAKRSDFCEVYRIIIEDLKKAEVMMREYDAGQTQKGRCCKWAATALKSSVYLTIGSLLAHPEDNFWDVSRRTPDFKFDNIGADASVAFKLAKDAADKVIEHGPYVLAPKYSDLFRWTEPEDWMLPERIIVITNSPSVQNTYNFSALRSLPRYITIASDGNANCGRFRPSRFFFQKWCETYPGAKGEGDALNIYVSSSDPRLDVSLIHTSFFRYNNNQERSIYPSSGKIYFTTMNGVDEQPYFKKYLDPAYVGDSGNADFYILRFAEMYLVSAEACAYLSSGPGDEYWNKAFERIEALHARARATNPGATQPMWAQDKFRNNEDADPTTDARQELIDGIFWERMFEMIGEGHEYYDTHRNGAAWLSRVIAVPKNTFLALPEQADFEKSSKTYKGYTTLMYGENFKYETDVEKLRRSLLCGFPHDEIVYNSSLTEADQNQYIIQ